MEGLHLQILVRIHGGDQNLLVRGHADLGQAYNNFKCYDQAYEHLSIALKKNEPDLETERGQEYQLFILKLLSINRLHQGKPDEALFYIEEAENICLSNQGSPLAAKDLAEVKRYHGEYFTAKGLYADAIECYQEVKLLLIRLPEYQRKSTRTTPRERPVHTRRCTKYT